MPQMIRYMTATVTFEPTEAMIRETYAAFHASVPQIKDVTGISWALSLEPVPPQLYTRGGVDTNALGLTNEKGRSLVVCLISPSWADAAHNDQVYDAARNLMDDITARAKTLGAHTPYIYLDYAAPWQDVIQSYGAENVRKLQRLRARVDPNQVFTKRVTGGFKIPDGDSR